MLKWNLLCRRIQGQLIYCFRTLIRENKPSDLTIYEFRLASIFYLTSIRNEDHFLCYTGSEFGNSNLQLGCILFVIEVHWIYSICRKCKCYLTGLTKWLWAKLYNIVWKWSVECMSLLYAFMFILELTALMDITISNRSLMYRHYSITRCLGSGYFIARKCV